MFKIGYKIKRPSCPLQCFGSSAIFSSKTRRFPLPLRKGFGFIGLPNYKLSHRQTIFNIDFSLLDSAYHSSGKRHILTSEEPQKNDKTVTGKCDLQGRPARALTPLG
jgi:hypothetical protein